MITPKAAPTTALEESIAYEWVTLRDCNICQRCRRNCGPIARDHRKNRSQGGSTTPANLQLLGLGCHQWKTEHPREAVAAGWAVPGWADPAEWPAARWVRTERGTHALVWVLYLNGPDVQGRLWVRITDTEANERMGN
ncbi:HNH endonuclease [Agromyces sp. SYSU T00194]|uniref:HNH endonuclease n=1 Tax=Agromyces chitinivorans TaxID=3158560 RepID=UPI0033991CB1